MDASVSDQSRAVLRASVSQALGDENVLECDQPRSYISSEHDRECDPDQLFSFSIGNCMSTVWKMSAAIEEIEKAFEQK